MSKIISPDKSLKRKSESEERQPGGLRYLDELIKIKVASDVVNQLKKLLEAAILEYQRWQAVAKISVASHETADENIKTVEKAKDTIKEATETLELIEKNPTNPVQDEKDKQEVKGIIQEVLFDVKTSNQAAIDNKATSDKYVGQDNLISIPLEQIQADRDLAVANKDSAKNAYSQIVSAHDKVKQIKSRRAIAASIQKQVSEASNQSSYEEQAWALIERETGVTLASAQALKEDAATSIVLVNKKLSESESTINQIEVQLRNAMKTQDHSAQPAVGSGNPFSVGH